MSTTEVVLVPGFLAGDYTLSVLSQWLSRIGYRPVGSGMIANVACMDRDRRIDPAFNRRSYTAIAGALAAPERAGRR